LGAILIFVGIKMTISRWYHMPTAASLAVIILILVFAIVLSIRKTKLDAEGSEAGSTMPLPGP
jgi:tellurite resistance protein TerC